MHTKVLHVGSWVQDPNALDWSQAGRDELTTALGNGLLVLSDEELGGGQFYLPDSVQRFAEGHPSESLWVGHNHHSSAFGGEGARWLSDAAAFDALLGSDKESGLRAGTELSANISTGMGHHLNSVDPDNIFLESSTIDAALSSLVEVSTRNEQANYDILTDNHDHPRFESNANAVKGLFSHDWGDDGAAVADLTDWIPDSAESDDPVDQQRAREASLGLMEMTTPEKQYNALKDTGVTVVGEDGKEYTNAAFGLVNPHLVQSVGDIAQTYLYDFGQGEIPEGTFSIHPDDDVLEVGRRHRMRFLEFAMADDVTAAELYSTVNGIDLASTQPLVDGQDYQQMGRVNGTMRALLDSALRSEALDRTGDDVDDQVADQVTRDRWLGIARTAGFAATVFPPGKIAVAGSFFLTGAGFQEYDLRVNQQEVSPNYQNHTDIGSESPYEPYAPNVYGQTHNPDNLAFKTQVDMLNALVNSGDVDLDKVREVDPRLVADDGKSVITYYEHTMSERERHGIQKSVETALMDVDTPQEVRPVRDASALNLANTYVSEYNDRHNAVMRELFPGISTLDYEEAGQK